MEDSSGLAFAILSLPSSILVFVFSSLRAPSCPSWAVFPAAALQFAAGLFITCQRPRPALNRLHRPGEYAEYTGDPHERETELCPPPHPVPS